MYLSLRKQGLGKSGSKVGLIVINGSSKRRGVPVEHAKEQSRNHPVAKEKSHCFLTLGFPLPPKLEGLTILGTKGMGVSP